MHAYVRRHACKRAIRARIFLIFVIEFSMSQKAVIVHCTGRQATEISVAQTSGQPGGVHAPDYREYLPHADPNHLLVADCPFSQLTGHHVVVIYDASSNQKANPCASRLTTNTENGLEIEIRGDALVLYTAKASDFSVPHWEELDNVIYDELLEYFGQGIRPTKSDIQRLVSDFKSGRFRYSVEKGQNDDDDDANKDDGSLPGWG